MTVRQRRCSASGTKLRVSSCATRRFTRRSASGKSSCGRQPRDSTALVRVECPREWARAVAGPALRSPVQFQRFPDGSPILRGPFHHDFVDLALDEPARERAQFGRARPNFVAFKLEVAFAFDVGHHHGNIFLCTSIQFRRSCTASASPAGAESVPHRISQGRRLSSVARTQRRPIIRSITHAPDHTVARPRLLHGSSRSRRSRHRILSNPNDFHFFSRASRPSPTQLRKSSSGASQPSLFADHAMFPGSE